MESQFVELVGWMQQVNNMIPSQNLAVALVKSSIEKHITMTTMAPLLCAQSELPSWRIILGTQTLISIELGSLRSKSP